MVRGVAHDGPRWWEWSIIGLLAAVVIAFGVLVVARSAYMNLRHTDLDVYTAAAWAARTGHDIYDVTNEDGLHYCYPPTFALAMLPLAEPPDHSRQSGYLPFGVSASLWYVLSCLFLFIAVHVLATTIEQINGEDISIGSRRWWAMRVWPILFTLPGIGGTLSHGQTNLLLLLLLTCTIATAIRNRSLASGVWLAAAAALKVIPAYLILAPIIWRDRKWVMGFGAGIVFMLLVLPCLILGPRQALQANTKFVNVMIAPALATHDKASRATEMFHVLRTDNQSIQAVLHAWQHWGNNEAPAQPSGPTRAVHWVAALILTSITIWPACRRRLQPDEMLLFLASMVVVMLCISPMCHLHYYCLTIPLVMALLRRSWQRNVNLWPGAMVASLMALHVAGGAFPLIFDRYRNLGFAPLTTLPMWFVAVRVLWTENKSSVVLPFNPAIAPQRKAA